MIHSLIGRRRAPTVSLLTPAAVWIAAGCAGAAQAPAPDVAIAAAAAATTGAITEADLRTRLYLVADDSMGGRPTGSPGHVMVTEYLASEMRRLGLQPAGDNGTYFQDVPFVELSLARGSGVRANNEALTLNVDYTPVNLGFDALPFAGAQVIYGGVVNDTTTQISSEQATGRIVVLRVPGNGIMIPRGRPGMRFEKAAGIAVVTSENAKRFWPQLQGVGRPRYRGAPAAAAAPEPQLMLLSAAGAQKLFGTEWGDSIRPGTAGATLDGSLRYDEKKLTARNVVAVLPGSDPALRGQYVAIGAHSDHDPVRAFAVDHDSLKLHNEMVRRMRIGRSGPVTAQEVAAIRVNVDSLRSIRPARRDSIMNGADDDGSGTVGVLEIAEAMAASPTKPRRSVLFVWHVAEELGLYGAQYFSNNPTVPRDSIVAQLNVDMIGRGGVGEEIGGGPTYLQLIGWRRLSNELGDIIETINTAQPQPFSFDLKYDADGHPEQYYCRSDHYEYAKYGIPVAFFTTGSHGDYHQVTDEPQYIDYAKLLNVTKLIHDVAVHVGNLPHRPAVDGPKPDPTGQCRQ